RVRVEPAIIGSVLALIECDLPSTSIEVIDNWSIARSPFCAGFTALTTPFTMLPAGIGAAVPSTTESLTFPVHASPTCAFSDAISVSAVRLIAVPAGISTPGLLGFTDWLGVFDAGFTTGGFGFVAAGAGGVCCAGGC